MRRRDADERALRRAGRRAGQADLLGDPDKTRISLRVEQKVVVQYACDGKQFAVSVRDAFGTLERNTVLRYLYKCLHSEQQIDRKVGGAGLGLYLMVNSATTVFFNVLPGVATEAVCVFDLETPKLQLEQLRLLHREDRRRRPARRRASRRLPRHRPSGRAPARAPPPPPPPRGLIAVLGDRDPRDARARRQSPRGRACSRARS